MRTGLEPSNPTPKDSSGPQLAHSPRSNGFATSNARRKRRAVLRPCSGKIVGAERHEAAQDHPLVRESAMEASGPSCREYTNLPSDRNEHRHAIKPV